MKILKPYFYPDGCLNKSRVVLTYVALFVSKTCSILTPLYIGYVRVCLCVCPWYACMGLGLCVVIYACMRSYNIMYNQHISVFRL